jgi:uncharacterized protein (TIGR00270 family)
MVECEVCGRIVTHTRRSEIDGVVLEVCDDCSGLGEEREEPKKLLIRTRIDYGNIEEDEKELASDFAFRIRRAREQKNLTQDEAAMKMAISQKIYKRIEGGFKPDESTAKKIQKFYSINLYEEA